MLHMCGYMHSRFIENHPIWILQEGLLISEVVLSHYVTHRSDRMLKHKFGIMYPGALFVKSKPVQHKHEIYCVNISRLGRTRKHCVTRRSHRM
jgi:hypothetical protein